MSMNDKLIVKMYFDRNEDAISETAKKYGSYCNAIALNILNNSEDAEECVNDTYHKAWNSIPPNNPSVLRTFLGKITRNLAFDLYKKRKAQKRGAGQIELVLDELGELVSGDNEPERELDKKELVNALNSFLGTLSEEKCALFVRRYWYAESISDIAKSFGLRDNNVSVSLNRLRKKLRDYLLERGFEL